MTQTEIRQMGFNYQVVQRAFIWQNLGRDLIRQLVEYDPTYKTQLENHLLCAFHGYSRFPSAFYQNMYKYLKMGLAEAKDLTLYIDRTYMMYREQFQKQYNSRETVKLIDFNGKVLDMVQI